MDRIESYRLFVRVVECRSFTRAADTLRIPRSTVSTVIRDLETRIGARLLHRTTRRVAPTADGNAFYEQCIRLLADFEETETLFRYRTAQPRGKLRVSAPARIARRILAPALPDFFAACPEIEIELGATDRTLHPVEEGIDCAVRVGSVRSPDLLVCDLGALNLCNCASPEYLATRGRPECIADLARHTMIQYISPVTHRAEPWEYVQQGTVRELALPAQVSVDSAELYIACCLAGLGLIQVPAYDVRDHLLSGRLVEVLPAFPAAPMSLSIVYPRQRHLSRRLRAFVEWATALFAQQVQ